jgi:hypothetical protein
MAGISARLLKKSETSCCSAAVARGPPTAIVVYPDTRGGEAVEIDRVIARE